MNPLLLAELELDPQAILFVIVAVFSFLKWLFDNLTAKNKGGKSREERANELEELYDQYREEIQQRQTQTPPPLPQQQDAYFEVVTHDSGPPPLPQEEPEPDAYETPEPAAPLYTAEDIQRAQLIKSSAALAQEPTVGKVKRRKSSTASSSIKQMLRSKGSLKKAIILQEVLGEPKALK